MFTKFRNDSDNQRLRAINKKSQSNKDTVITFKEPQVLGKNYKYGIRKFQSKNGFHKE